jgi:hypothetical protein
VKLTKARTIEVKLNRKVLYELDGGDRSKVKSFKARVEPGAVSVCVPFTAGEDRREGRNEYLAHR